VLGALALLRSRHRRGRQARLQLRDQRRPLLGRHAPGQLPHRLRPLGRIGGLALTGLPRLDRLDDRRVTLMLLALETHPPAHERLQGDGRAVDEVLEHDPRAEELDRLVEVLAELILREDPGGASVANHRHTDNLIVPRVSQHNSYAPREKSVDNSWHTSCTVWVSFAYL
jgi:hypothetical protein